MILLTTVDTILIGFCLRISLFVAGGAKEPSANVSEEEFIINFIIVV